MLNQRVTCRIAKIISISLCALMLIACERSAPGSSSHADSFEKQQLNGHDFRGANLAGAKFDGAVLVGAHFVGANLKPICEKPMHREQTSLVQIWRAPI